MIHNLSGKNIPAQSSWVEKLWLVGAQSQFRNSWEAVENRTWSFADLINFHFVHTSWQWDAGFELRADNKLVPLLFSLEDTASILIHLPTEQFPTLPQSILNELWSREDGRVSGSCSHMASSLHDRALTCMARWAVFTDNDFWKCSWAHAVISWTESGLFLMQSCLRAWDYGHQILTFSPYAQRWLQILWIIWYDVL